eukprot:CAMPEP_0171923106 /NCGR_PEP_ID=MMETSP0993-20121228/21784_1 /TAXON_ID=483369 /ORGANISM="non described non described, Strain CCMP2098" /LENGTH=275 /DNA_ID=CAMNT_0012560997 /DNA_START=339 /DNA_END=1170 /DNA_ORIENTATION=+
MAYFRTAKLNHPDVVKDSAPSVQAAAKQKWQEAANAYEVLSDANKRAAYDRGPSATGSSGGGGWPGGASSSSSWGGGGAQQDANAQSQWDDVTSDSEVVEEAINEYAEELKENAAKAAEGAANGDFTEVWNFVKQHKGLVATVVVPSLLIFRFPAPAFAALRFLPQAMLALLGLALRIGGTRGVQQLWSVVGHLVLMGSKGAAGELRAYTEKRKKLREQARQQAKDDKQSRAPGDANNTKSSSSNRKAPAGAKVGDQGTLHRGAEGTVRSGYFDL